MPHDLPPWGTVWWYFRKWRKDGTWERVEEALRPMVRESEGRDATPSGAIIDSQSVKNHGKRGPGAMTQAKKCPGRKRHIVVDTNRTTPRGGGGMLPVFRTGTEPSWCWADCWAVSRGLQIIWADAAYAGKLIAWAWATGGWLLQVVRRSPDSHHFEVLPRRWVVERTLAWLSRCRRLSKDYEELPETGET